MRRWRSWALVGLGVVALAAIATLTLRSMIQTSTQSPRVGGSSPGPKCSPKPCTELDGWELYVSNVQRSPGRLTLDVSFRNHTTGGPFEASSYRHSNTRDFQLVTAGGGKVQPVFGAGCPRWEEARIERGGSAGPDHLCFDVAGDTLKETELDWSPDTGLLGASGTVPLP